VSQPTRLVAHNRHTRRSPPGLAGTVQLAPKKPRILPIPTDGLPPMQSLARMSRSRRVRSAITIRPERRVISAASERSSRRLTSGERLGGGRPDQPILGVPRSCSTPPGAPNDATESRPGGPRVAGTTAPPCRSMGPGSAYRSTDTYLDRGDINHCGPRAAWGRRSSHFGPTSVGSGLNIPHTWRTDGPAGQP
jgi:hypothetical protein